MRNLYKWSIYREMLYLLHVMTLSFLSFLSTFSFLYVWCKIKLSADENNERTEMMKRHIRKKFMLEDGSYCYFDNLRFHNVIKELSQKSVNEGKRKTQSELIMEVSMAINVSESSIYHWIKGDNSPSDISRVEELAKFLRISLFDIVEKEELSVGGNNKNMSFSNEGNGLNEKSVVRDIYLSMVDYIEEFRKTVAFENDVSIEGDEFEMNGTYAGVDMYNQILIKIRKAMFDIPYEIYQKLYCFTNGYLYFFTGDEIIPIWYLSSVTEDEIEKRKEKGIDMSEFGPYIKRFVGYETYSKKHEWDEWRTRVEYVDLVADTAYVIIREILDDYLIK